MKRNDPLSVYRQKRDFAVTREPSEEDRRPRERQEPVYVLQKHLARRLHYDFRLQVGEVLKSWAVPKGLSSSSRERRLAVPTEDHPLAYAGFEGVIPQGQYGAGAVMVWDTGTYRNIKKDEKGNVIPMPRGYEKGSLEVFLEGKKIRGTFTLIRMKGKKEWLIIKMKHLEGAPKDSRFDESCTSALTGRTMDEIQKYGVPRG